MVASSFPLFFHVFKAISSVHVNIPNTLIQMTLKYDSGAPI